MEHMPRMLNDGTPITSPLAPAPAHFGPQEPPADPRSFNRRQPDGTFRPLSEFFDAPARSERPDRGEPPFGTTWEYLDSQDAQDAYAEPNEDERTIEYEDYREGLADRYLRPDFVDWRRDRE